MVRQRERFRQIASSLCVGMRAAESSARLRLWGYSLNSGVAQADEVAFLIPSRASPYEGYHGALDTAHSKNGLPSRSKPAPSYRRETQPRTRR